MEPQHPVEDGEEVLSTEIPLQHSWQEDALSAHVTAGGVVSTYKNAEQRRQRLERKQASDFIRKAHEHADNVRQDLRDAEARLHKAQSTVNDAQNDWKACHARLGTESDQAIDRPNRHGVQLAQQHLDAAAYRMRQAEAVLAQEYSIMVWQQDRLDGAEKMVMKTDELATRVREVEMSEKQEMALVAEYRAAREQEAADRAHRATQQQLDEVHKAREKREAQTQQALAVAEEGRKKTVERLRAATGGLAQKLAELEDYKQQQRSRQQQALLELKRNSEAAFNKMKGRNEAARKKKAKEDAAHLEEKKVILQNGGNPYEVFRRRREEDRQKKEYAKLVQKQKEGEAQIAKMMVREEELFQKDMKQKAKENEYELHFQKEMGRAAMEERLDKFMKKRTLGGVDIIDPTSIKESALVAVPSSFDKAGTASSAPLHGSHVTVVKTSRFGLGDLNYVTNKDGDVYTTSEDVLKAVENKFPGTTFDPTFVPEEYENTSDGPEQFDASKLGPSAVDRHGELVDELAKSEFEGMWKSGTAYGGEGSRGVIDPEEVNRQRIAALQIKTTKLSVLEQRMMSTVPGKIRKNIVKPQIACGREFQGRSFVAENLTQPSSQDRIEFIDFKVGQVYKQTIRMTNVSYTFNTFKLKHLPDSIRDFFDIQYKLPGYISAGLTCDLHITFEPKVPEDINAVLPLLTETGEIGIPLTCTTPRTKIGVKPRVLALGSVPICEEVTEYVTVTNDGALGTGYSLFDPDAWTPRGDDESVGSQDGQGIVQASATKLTDEEQILQDIYAATPNDRRVLRFEKAGIVSGYKSVRVPITFRPCVLGKWTGTIHINFADAGTPDISIALSAVVTQEPIYLKKPVVDFQTVLYDHVYRDSLIVYNRGKTAMKCELRLPEEAAGLRKSLEFLPPLGFPQNDGFFAFQLKFRPEPNMWNQISDAYGDPETGCIEFPMLVTVPDQSLPVRWTFKAQISPGDLVFEPKILDFGVCSCNEAVAMDVKVINTSALPQEVGFVRLKPEVSVQPNDGFLSLLPKETTVIQVLFAPRSAVDYQFGLMCKTITGKQCRPNPTLTVQKEYEIPCRGTGLFPAVEVSCSVLKMAAVAEGGRTSESIVLSNSGKEVQQFEFTPQPESNVSVTPAHGRLQPGEKRRITVEFRAHAAAQSVQSDTPLDAGSAQPTDTEWSEHRRWLVPCFFRVEPEDGKRIRVEHLNVEVHTTTIRPIVADEDGLVYRELDFGQVPLGPGKVVKFMLNNKGATEAKMSCSALDPNGAFIMLSGSRPIPATGKVQVVMCFDPPEVGSFEQSVRIQTSANEYTVVCKGEGVRPKLRIEPDLTGAGTRRGSLHVGDAVCSRAVGKTLRLCNETQQPMSWSAHITDLRRSNSNGLEPFFVVPPRGTIDGGGEVDVEVRFCPDHQSTGFGGLLNFDVPSQNETHQVELMGRGWHQGAFVVGGDEEAAEARADAMAHVLPDLFDSLGNGGTEPKRMTLTLRYDTVLPPELSEGEEGGAPLACGLITAGNAGDAAEKGGAADIAFDALPPDTGFAMRVAGKLAFGPQEVAKVGFVFTPPSLEQLRQADDPKKKEAAALLELGIGFWQEATVMCTLKGGAPAPEGGSASVALKLRAYVDAA